MNNHRNLICEHIMQKRAQKRTDALADLEDLVHALQSNSDLVDATIISIDSEKNHSSTFSRKLQSRK